LTATKNIFSLIIFVFLFQFCISCLVLPICCAISAVFFALAFAVIAAFPDLRETGCGNLLLVVLASMATANLARSASELGFDVNSTGCRFLAFCIQVGISSTRHGPY
jgi:uncharacterized membrane protein